MEALAIAGWSLFGVLAFFTLGVGVTTRIYARRCRKSKLCPLCLRQRER